MGLLTASLLTVFYTTGAAWGAPVNQQAIADLAAGKITEAKASWWGFDPSDSTAALQAAINSGARRVIVENMGQPWIVDQITLVSDQEIFFEPGAEVLAKKGAFKGPNDSLFTASLKRNITLIGYGATLRMRRSDYAGPDYVKAEWRMVLNLLSCENVRVYGLTLAESGGDGIYLGTATDNIPNRNIHIKDVVCDRNYRQGISVINAENLLIEDTVMQYTAGTAPMAGIDFEPNGPGERIRAVMRNCTTRYNQGWGCAVYVRALNASSVPISLRLENCRSLGDKGGGLFVATGNTEPGAVLGTMDFIGCLFRRNGGPGILIYDKPVQGCRMRFDRCKIQDVARAAGAPIQFATSADARRDVGGVEFVDCLVEDRAGRQPMAFADASTGVGVFDVTGNLVLERGGERHHVRLTPSQVRAWMPYAPLVQIASYPMTGVRLTPRGPVEPGAPLCPDFVRVRSRASYLLHATEGDQVRLRVRYDQVAAYFGADMPVVVTGPEGSEVAQVIAPFKAETEVAFTAPATGVYRIYCEPGNNYVQIISSSHPLNLDATRDAIPFYSTTGTLYFWVPGGATTVGVLVRGEGLEHVKVGLYDPSGTLVEEHDNISSRHQFVIRRSPTQHGEVWSLRFDRPSEGALEDYSVELQGVPPLLAASPDTLLVPVQ